MTHLNGNGSFPIPTEFCYLKGQISQFCHHLLSLIFQTERLSSVERNKEADVLHPGAVRLQKRQRPHTVHMTRALYFKSSEVIALCETEI